MSANLFERRNFLTGSDFGSLQEKGTVKRTSVSNMEIWCECFGKERANLRRTDSNELTGILARLGWKRAESKVRIPLYGPCASPSMGRSTSLFRRGVPNEETLRHKIREQVPRDSSALWNPRRNITWERRKPYKRQGKPAVLFLCSQHFLYIER